MARTYSHIFLKYKAIWLAENKRLCTTCHRLLELKCFSFLKQSKDGYRDKCKECANLNKNSILDSKFDWVKTRTHKLCMACGQEQVIDNFVLADKVFTLDGKGYVCIECDKNYEPISKDRNNYHRLRRKNIKENKPEEYRKERDKLNLERKEQYKTDEEFRNKIKERTRLFRLNNPEKVRISQKIYYEKHKTELLKYLANWRMINKEKIKDYNETYPCRKPEIVAKSKRDWAINNPDKRRASEHKSRANNREKLQIRNKKRQASKLLSINNYSSSDIQRKRLYQDNCCFYCNKVILEDETIEHIVPLNILADNSTNNIVLACRSCNSSKQDKLLDIEWDLPHTNNLPLYNHLNEILTEIQNWLFSKNIDSFISNKKSLQINSHRLNINFISLFWDSDRYINNTSINNNNYTNLFFFEDEWEFNKESCKNLILHKLNLSNKIGARKTVIDYNVSFQEADLFLKQNHIFKNDTHSQYRLGLRLNNELVGLALFTRNGITPHSNSESIEWSRLCFKESIIGGASKLLYAFINKYSRFKEIITYADLMKSEGNLYFKLGFNIVNIPTKDYQYVLDFKRYRKRRFQHKNLLQRLNFYDPKLTEKENTRINGIYRIWTPGTAKFKLVL